MESMMMDADFPRLELTSALEVRTRVTWPLMACPSRQDEKKDASEETFLSRRMPELTQRPKRCHYGRALRPVDCFSDSALSAGAAGTMGAAFA